MDLYRPQTSSNADYKVQFSEAVAASPSPSEPESTSAALGKGRRIADRLTVGKDGEAVRAAPDQIPPFRPTPILDRDYMRPDQFFRGYKGNLHTQVSDEKMQELRRLPKAEYLKKMQRIHHQDNRDLRDAWARGDDVAGPSAKKRKANGRQ